LKPTSANILPTNTGNDKNVFASTYLRPAPPCATFAVSHPLMRSLFHHPAPEPPPAIEPVPTIFPKIEGADIAAVFAGKRVAGDFYDSIRVSPERVLFGLLDVAGQREDTRSILVAAQDIFRNLGSRLFSPGDINEADAMTELCLNLNRGLIEASKGVHPCPAFVGCYHEKFGTLCYTNAGHTSGLLRDSSGVAELASTGLPLGLFSHATCDSPIAGLAKGSSLVLISRGVVECGSDRGKSAEEFGLERVKELLKDIPTDNARALCTSVLNAAGKQDPRTFLCDDRTALALIRTV
jgi:serine phosphatase RsbU (regulator of sigma subunit)